MKRNYLLSISCLNLLLGTAEDGIKLQLINPAGHTIHQATLAPDLFQEIRGKQNPYELSQLLDQLCPDWNSGAQYHPVPGIQFDDEHNARMSVLIWNPSLHVKFQSSIPYYENCGYLVKFIGLGPRILLTAYLSNKAVRTEASEMTLTQLLDLLESREGVFDKLEYTTRHYRSFRTTFWARDNIWQLFRLARIEQQAKKLHLIDVLRYAGWQNLDRWLHAYKLLDQQNRLSDDPISTLDEFLLQPNTQVQDLLVHINFGLLDRKPDGTARHEVLDFDRSNLPADPLKAYEQIIQALESNIRRFRNEHDMQNAMDRTRPERESAHTGHSGWSSFFSWFTWPFTTTWSYITDVWNWLFAWWSS